MQQQEFILCGKKLRVQQRDSESSSNRRPRQLPSRGPSAVRPYHSPAIRGIEQHVSGMTPMSPAGYGMPTPYSYPYSPYYGYGNPFIDGQGHYYSAPYSPSYYPSFGSPTYDARSAGSVDFTGSPVAHTGYYYPPYQYPPAPYWSIPPSTQEPQGSSPSTYQPPVYPSTGPSGNVSDDRSATPTPAGFAPIVESQLESH